MKNKYIKLCVCNIVKITKWKKCKSSYAQRSVLDVTSVSKWSEIINSVAFLRWNDRRLCSRSGNKRAHKIILLGFLTYGYL